MDNSSYNTPLDLAIKDLKSLKPGETYVYFTGFLESEKLNNPDSDSCKLAAFAFSLMEAGKVILVQKRLSRPYDQHGALNWSSGMGHGFHYIAVGVTPKVKKPNITYSQIVKDSRR